MPVVRPLIAIAALSLSACSEDMLSFPGASTVDDCRAAHENARMGNNINGGGSLGRSLIDDTLQRCLSRVASGGPIETGASIGLTNTTQPAPMQSVPVAADPLPRTTVQTSGFCPPKVSVLYGGTSYCVRQ